MGKPTGFLEYDREVSKAVKPHERIKNFNEFHTPLSRDHQQEQAARCMECGVPFCQSGMTLMGMTSGCPLHNLVPEWNDLVYTGNWKQAYNRLKKTNNFPEFTGREGAVGILIGGVLLVLWSGILRRQMTVFRDPIRYLGKAPAWLIAGIWESYLVFTGGWLVGKVGHLAGEYLVSGVPETLLSLIFVLAALGGSHHVQARGRLAQISWGVAAWLGGILLLLAAVQNSPSLEMVWGDQHLETTGFDWKRSVKSIGKYVAYGSGIGLMTWLTVQVRDSKEKRRKEGLAPAIGQLSLWFLTGAVLLTVNFGTDATTMNTCPILEVMAGVELPGGFLRRVDLIFLSILLFSLVFLLGSIFFYSSYVADRIHISIGRLPSAILCFLLGTTAQKQWNWSRQYPRMLSRVYLPVCLMMTVCAAWARRKSYGKR